MLSTNNRLKILVIERDHNLKKVLNELLKKENWQAQFCKTLNQAQAFTLSNRYRLIIADCNLNNEEDLNFIMNLHQRDPLSLTLMIGAKDNPQEILAYQMCINIYHYKPIQPDLLVAQIQMLTSIFKEKVVFELEDIRIDICTSSLWIQDNLIDLTYREFKLILLLIRMEGTPIKREVIVAHLSNCRNDINFTSVDTTICRIRKKINPYISLPFIETINRVGYRINPIYFAHYKIKSR